MQTCSPPVGDGGSAERIVVQFCKYTRTPNHYLALHYESPYLRGISTMELLLIPAAIASGCHRPLLRWSKTARPCTAKVSANGSELCAICGRLVVITARIKCTAVGRIGCGSNKFCRQNSESTNVTDSPQQHVL